MDGRRLWKLGEKQALTWDEDLRMVRFFRQGDLESGLSPRLGGKVPPLGPIGPGSIWTGIDRTRFAGGGDIQSFKTERLA